MHVNAPIGTSKERASAQIWPGFWEDKTGFGANTVAGYADGYHTGADLNLNHPTWDADKGAPVYAAADGTVIWSNNYHKSWGWIVVIEHVDDDGKKYYTRYGHMNHTDFLVTPAHVPVTIGQIIGHIGNADGYYKDANHLHFDVSLTDILTTTPDHWPGTVRNAATLANLNLNYTDPKVFLLAHHTPTAQPASTSETLQVISTGLSVRAQPNRSTAPIGTLKNGDKVEVSGSITGDGYHFAALLIVNGVAYPYQPAFVAREFLGPV